jgi:hypothetical protein
MPPAQENNDSSELSAAMCFGDPHDRGGASMADKGKRSDVNGIGDAAAMRLLREQRAAVPARLRPRPSNLQGIYTTIQCAATFGPDLERWRPFEPLPT